MRWVMPEIFHDIPLAAEDDDEMVSRFEDLAAKALPGTADEDQTRFAVLCALGLDDLRASGAEYAGICVTAVGSEVCTATVMAALVDSPDEDGSMTPARTIASGLRRTTPDEVSELELPCGPAVSAIGTRTATLTGDMTETGENLVFPTSFIRVYVPLPNGAILVMELSTATMAGWDMFSTMFGNIVSSIRLFRADGAPVIVPEAAA
ncbi:MULTISPECIES: hypothetical protein [unclassified Streptomyces]|uniref:hypothetical protein n=2 Tax=Streptomyces TaxID=1883 RepID=UPI00202E6BB3|nr:MULTISPECIES: hypothetical protein [unclassified Streptomyces]MCM1973650.1 hypothetical protein [Streptomyces sp. G1]WBO80097.1 hypothetical protein SBE_003848 [Streptomyces sp. SBE_14.2]